MVGRWGDGVKRNKRNLVVRRDEAELIVVDHGLTQHRLRTKLLYYNIEKSDSVKDKGQGTLKGRTEKTLGQFKASEY